MRPENKAKRNQKKRAQTLWEYRPERPVAPQLMHGSQYHRRELPKDEARDWVEIASPTSTSSRASGSASISSVSSEDSQNSSSSWWACLFCCLNSKEAASPPAPAQVSADAGGPPLRREASAESQAVREPQRDSLSLSGMSGGSSVRRPARRSSQRMSVVDVPPLEDEAEPEGVAAGRSVAADEQKYRRDLAVRNPGVFDRPFLEPGAMQATEGEGQSDSDDDDQSCEGVTGGVKKSGLG